jgi:cytochrome c oxidase subunit IV
MSQEAVVGSSKAAPLEGWPPAHGPGAPVHGSRATGHTHGVPLRVLLLVWAALLVLTGVTVGVRGIDLGAWGLWVAMAIATVKATLVLLYFMHMRYDRPINAIVFIAALLFVTLFVGFALLDTTAYGPELIPGYAPAIRP